MADYLKCQLCSENFEKKFRIPMKLPCGHNICYSCAHEQYKEKKSIKCLNKKCNRVHKLHPTRLQEDENMLKQLDETILNVLITALEEQQGKIKKVYQKLKEQQFNIVQQFIQQSEKHVLSNSLKVQKELQALQRQIENEIKGLNYIRDQQQVQQQDIPDVNENELIKQTNKLIEEAQKNIQQLNQTQINVYEQLKNSENIIQEIKNESEHINYQIIQLNEFINTLNQEIVAQKESIKKLQHENQSLIQQTNLQQKQIEILKSELSQEKEKAIELNNQFQEFLTKQSLQITIVSPNQRTLQFETRYIETIQQIKEKIKQFTDINP